MKKKDELEELKRLMLPKTINLHSMITKSVEYVSDPTFVNDGMLQQLKSEEQAWTFVLEDVANQMQLTVKLIKTLHHELK